MYVCMYYIWIINAYTQCWTTTTTKLHKYHLPMEVNHALRSADHSFVAWYMFLYNAFLLLFKPSESGVVVLVLSRCGRLFSVHPHYCVRFTLFLFFLLFPIISYWIVLSLNLIRFHGTISNFKPFINRHFEFSFASKQLWMCVLRWHCDILMKW